VRDASKKTVTATALRAAKIVTAVALRTALGVLAASGVLPPEPAHAQQQGVSVVLVPGTAPARGAKTTMVETKARVDTISLEDAIRIALSRSPAIREAESARLTAKAGRWEEWGRLIPSISLSTGFSQSRVLQRTATDPVTGGIVELPDSLIETRETFGTEAVLSADWTLFDGGEAYWKIRRSNAEADAGEFAYRAARARVAADVKLAYLTALEARALETARRADLERARGLAEVAAARFRVGEVPELDDLQARLAVSDAEIALLEAEEETDAARLALFEHLALSPDTEVALVEPEGADASAFGSEEELRHRAMEQSRELAALRESQKAADRALSAEKWRFLPSITVGADWVRSEFGQTRDALTFSPSNEQTFYRLGMTWSSLEQPGGLVADRRRARAELWRAESRLAAREASLAREVEVALGQLRRARLLQEKSRLNLNLAERQREQASERYRLGLGSIIERLNAEVLAAEARRQAIGARYATLRALAELERAAGIQLTLAQG
jgi:outer membrane protein